MDNKKWYQRFGVVFWWGFTILPLIIFLIYFIGYHLTFNSGISSSSDLTLYHENGLNINVILSNVMNNFKIFVPSSFNSSFTDLFDVLSITDYSFAYLLSYMIWVQVIHLIFDVFVWLPHFFHKIFEKESK